MNSFARHGSGSFSGHKNLHIFPPNKQENVLKWGRKATSGEFWSLQAAHTRDLILT